MKPTGVAGIGARQPGRSDVEEENAGSSWAEGGVCRLNDMKHSGHLQRLAVRLYRMRSDSKRATVRDRVLAGRLRDAFERDLALSELSGIHFYAFGGVVTIYGSVRHELDRDLLVEFVRRVQGVRNVVEHLRISGG